METPNHLNHLDPPPETATLAEGKIDWQQFRAVVDLSFKQQYRPNRDVATGKTSHPLRGLIFSLFLLGFMFSGNAERCADLHSYLIVLFIGVFGLVTFGVLPDTYDIRRRNIEVLHSKPISQRTLAFGRATMLLLVAGIFASCFGAIPLYRAVTHFSCPLSLLPWLYFLLVIGCFASVVIWLTILMFGAQWLNLNKLRSLSLLLFVLVMLSQVFISLAFVFSRDVTSGASRKISFSSYPLTKILPPVWFVDCLTADFSTTANLERLGVITILGAAFLVVWKLDVEGYYPKLIEKLLNPVEQKAHTPFEMRVINSIRRLPMLGKWLIPSKVFAVTSAILLVTGREDASRMRTLMTRLVILCFFVVGMVSSRDLSSIIVMYGFICLIDGVDITKQCSHSTASWLFPYAPLNGKELLSGIRWAVLARAFALPLVLVTILYKLRNPIFFAGILTIEFIIEAGLIISVVLIFKPAYPLSQDSKVSRSIISSLMGVFVAVFCSGIHALLVFSITEFRYAGVMVLGVLCLVSYAANGLAARSLSRLEYQDSPNPHNKKSRKLLWATAVTVTVLVLLLANVLFLPPLGGVPKVPRKVVAAVRLEENAWAEYAQAIQKLEDPTYGLPLEQQSTIFRFVAGKLPLDKTVREILDHNSQVLEHFLAGTKRQRFAYFQDSKNRDPKHPSHLTFSVEQLALAQGKRCELEKQPSQAVEYYLAAYKFEADLNANLYRSPYLGKNVSQALFYWVNYAGVESVANRQLAHQLAALEKQTPSLLEVAKGDLEYQQAEVENFLLPSSQSRVQSILDWFPGFRQRVFRCYLEDSLQVFEIARPSFETWDFQGRKTAEVKIQALFEQDWQRPWYVQSPARSFASRMLPLPFSSRNMMTLYLERADRAALEVFFSALVYKKAHGVFPETLSEAMAEVGLPAPIDPATRKPVGYRLENKLPVVWLSGFDGEDSGGKDIPLLKYGSYDLQSDLKGDVIYRLGEMPAHLKPVTAE